ncbi:MAG: Holliday junction branch migration protein RuvA [Propionibacteriaceae bacterium]|nr:Holliday junction branch migration protein RuvA [Propionibacteriaceae bacterium]
MISQLVGKVAQVTGTWVVMNVNGFGMKVFCTPNTAAKLKAGQEATLHTALVLRQDSVTLFGFAEASERDCYEIVQTATGIGPKTALAVLSVFSPDELRTAISAADVKTITKVPGIGTKVAQRLIIELKDKLGTTSSAGMPITAGMSIWQEQVQAGLEGLGYSSRDAEAAVENVRELAAADPEPEIAELLRAALRSLAKK